MKKIKTLVGTAVLGALLFAGCSTGPSTPSSAQNDQKASNSALKGLQVAQPTPRFAYSQLRQNMIELETAQADSTQTTTFMFNQGVTDPITSCPSIGFPIAAADELTNPQQVIDGSGSDGGGNVTLAQSDPTGIYAGNSTGTYVICVNAAGKGYAVYWEGFVQTLSGPAVWDKTTHSVKLIGAPTAKFTAKK